MPCADAAAICEELKMEFKEPVKNEAPHNDLCSPICQCSCCAGFSISHVIASVSPIALFSLKPISSFLSSKSIEVAFSFWQPPRHC